MTEILDPGNVSLKQLRSIWRDDIDVEINPAIKLEIDAAADLVSAAVKGNNPIYGVNTGFGKLASVKIPSEDVETLQRNLILSHCCGVGEPLDDATTRLMIALKLISLGRGASGVRWEILTLLNNLLKHRISPVIPGQGSVGASGDLAPLAHLASVLIGDGKVRFKNITMAAREAFGKCGLSPVTLAAKEGLALINGTQFSTACGLVGLFEAWGNASSAVISSAMSTDAIMGSTQPLNANIHELRGHQGQIAVAAAMRDLMAGSEIRESHRDNDSRVQDPYCIRCQPQVTGAALDLLHFAGRTLEVEANAVTDNPLIISSENRILSGGNFHAEPVAFAADQIAMATAEIGAISQRRIALMVDPALSYDLPPFLTPKPGLHSGMMVAEITSAALMSENKHLANPCSTDSTPTSANQEDHVSMAAHGARRLVKMNDNLNAIIGIELICAAQGVEFRAPLKTSSMLRSVISRLRKDIPTLDDDRMLSDDIETAAELVKGEELQIICNLPEYVTGRVVE